MISMLLKCGWSVYTYLFIWYKLHLGGARQHTVTVKNGQNTFVFMYDGYIDEPADGDISVKADATKGDMQNVSKMFS